MPPATDFLNREQLRHLRACNLFHINHPFTTLNEFVFWQSEVKDDSKRFYHEATGDPVYAGEATGPSRDQS